MKKMADIKLRRDYEDVVALLDCIPKEVLNEYAKGTEEKEICH